jgi:hypothetical protein
MIIVSQKMIIIIVTAVETSNLTCTGFRLRAIYTCSWAFTVQAVWLIRLRISSETTNI